MELSLNESHETIRCELVLSAAGRVPNCDSLNLSNAGVKRDERGFIEISESFRSSNENIFALGDAVDTPAHTAYAKIVALNIANSSSLGNAHLSPTAIFTIPKIASCGLKESEAKGRGIEVEILKAYYKANALLQSRNFEK